jgi:hypothetical protein
LVSSVVFNVAEALPDTATLIAGLVQVALKDAELSQPALQSAAAEHCGGVKATAHLGAVYATEQPPEQLPPHLTVALAATAQLPLQLPLQVPLQAPPVVVVPAAAVQVPSQVPLQVPLHAAATLKSDVQVPWHVASQVPLKFPGSHSAAMSGAVQLA